MRKGHNCGENGAIPVLPVQRAGRSRCCRSRMRRAARGRRSNLLLLPAGGAMGSQFPRRDGNVPRTHCVSPGRRPPRGGADGRRPRPRSAPSPAWTSPATYCVAGTAAAVQPGGPATRARLNRDSGWRPSRGWDRRLSPGSRTKQVRQEPSGVSGDISAGQRRRPGGPGR